MKNIAILTSGGDCQGMNACISIIVKMAEFNNINVYGIRQGYKGLLENDMYLLKYEDVSNIKTVGGTVLYTARCPEFMKKESHIKCANILKKRKIDALIVIGGDGSFRGVRDLNEYGVKAIAIPGTIDNDLFYTDASLGFYTAVDIAVNAIKCIQQTMRSHERCGVIEVMGRNCGSVALHAAVAAASEVVAVQEFKLTEEEIVKKVKECVKKGIKSPTVIVAENQYDIKELVKKIEKATKKETRGSVLGYIQRGGEPVVRDHMLAMQFAVHAFELLMSGNFNRAVGSKGRKTIDVSMDEALSATSNFNTEIYEIFNKLNA